MASKSKKNDPPEMIQLDGKGHDEALNLDYDRKYKIGNTTCFVVAPKITPEENEKVLKGIGEVLSKINGYPTVVRRKELPA